MDQNSTKLMEELELHVQQIINTYDPKKGSVQNLNVTERRGHFVNALKRLIDERVREILASRGLS